MFLILVYYIYSFIQHILFSPLTALTALQLLASFQPSDLIGLGFSSGGSLYRCEPPQHFPRMRENLERLDLIDISVNAHYKSVQIKYDTSEEMSGSHTKERNAPIPKSWKS